MPPPFALVRWQTVVMPDHRLVCALCGTQADSEEPPLTWATSVENGRTLVFCDLCARDNLRGIEGKLDSAWW